MKVYIGTAGYTNEDWVGNGPGFLYPPGTKKTDFLAVYSQHFDAVELNSSFYGIPSLKAFEGMARRSGGRTRLAVKLHQVFTHQCAPTDQDFDMQLQHPQPLREAGIMGPYLAQFPYRFGRSPQNRKYLAHLVERFAGHELALEFRHESWDRPEVRASLSDLGLIWVSPDYPPVAGLPDPALHVTTEVGYLRLHGRNSGNWWAAESAAERHDYRYTRAEMDEWAEKIAFVTGELEELYVFFANTTKGHALHNIPMFRQALNARGVVVHEGEAEQAPLLSLSHPDF